MNGTVLLVVLAALIVSARTRVNATVLGQPVSVPVLGLVFAAVVLGLVFAAVVLGLVALILVLARLLLRDGLRLRPRMVNL